MGTYFGISKCCQIIVRKKHEDQLKEKLKN